jgi:hypothetical protein
VSSRKAQPRTPATPSLLPIKHSLIGATCPGRSA